MKEKDIKQIVREYTKFFDEKKLYNNLALASLYLATFELLKSTIIVNIRNFFSVGELIDTTKKRPKEYEKEMQVFLKKYTGKRDAEYLACCDWLIEMSAISCEDKSLLVAIKNQRNEIAHELAYILLERDRNIDTSYLEKANKFIEIIDRWWIINVDIPCTDAFDGREIKEEDIKPSRSILLDHIFFTFNKKFFSNI